MLDPTSSIVSRGDDTFRSKAAHLPLRDAARPNVKHRLPTRRYVPIQGSAASSSRRCWTQRQVSSPEGTIRFGPRSRIVLFERRCWTTLIMLLLVVLFKNIVSKVVGQVPHNRMHVIGIILCI